LDLATDSTFSGSITQSTRTIALAKSGPGALTLSGNNSFNGGLAITNGAVIAAGTAGNVPIVSNVTLGDGSSAVFLIAGAPNSQFGPNTSVTFNNGSKDAKLMLRGTAQTLAGVDGTVGQSLSIIQNDEAGTPGYAGGAGLATLTLNTTSNHSFAGLIRNQEGGGLNIVKEGLGTQELVNVLVATSQYGDITINNGKLSFFMIPNGSKRISSVPAIFS
jgi:autotransporter-associated beta strand protein